MTKELQVRIGDVHDVHDMMDLALTAWVDENAFVEVNQQKLLSEIWHGLSLADGIVGIIGERGKPEGAVLLRIGKMWYSDDPILEERVVFIHPDYRSAKGGRARRLVEFSKHTAERLGLPLIIGVTSHHRTEAKVRLYERQFGKQAGAFFLHNCQKWKPYMKDVG